MLLTHSSAEKLSIALPLLLHSTVQHCAQYRWDPNHGLQRYLFHGTTNRVFKLKCTMFSKSLKEVMHAARRVRCLVSYHRTYSTYSSCSSLCKVPPRWGKLCPTLPYRPLFVLTSVSALSVKHHVVAGVVQVSTSLALVGRLILMLILILIL